MDDLLDEYRHKYIMFMYVVVPLAQWSDSTAAKAPASIDLARTTSTYHPHNNTHTLDT
jgi:hypothetical protein